MDGARRRRRSRHYLLVACGPRTPGKLSHRLTRLVRQAPRSRDEKMHTHHRVQGRHAGNTIPRWPNRKRRQARNEKRSRLFEPTFFAICPSLRGGNCEVNKVLAQAVLPECKHSRSSICNYLCFKYLRVDTKMRRT